VRASAEEALAAERGAAERLELELEDARARLLELQRPATDARAEAERLLGRLIAIESSLDDGRSPA
jgi:hypothetical protein